MTTRQNWSDDCENALNKQITMELYAFHYYKLLSSYFLQSNIGLENIGKYFKKSSDEENEHADKMIEYQLKRGGKYNFEGVVNISLDLDNLRMSNMHVKRAFELALELEKTVNNSLLELHSLADNSKDPAFCDFLEGNFLAEQVDANYELGKIISKLELIGNDKTGLYLFDHEFE